MTNINDGDFAFNTEFPLYQLGRMDITQICKLLQIDCHTENSIVEFLYTNLPNYGSSNKFEELCFVDGNCHNEPLTAHFPKAYIEIVISHTYDEEYNNTNGYIMSLYADNIPLLKNYPFEFDLNNNWELDYTLSKMMELHIKEDKRIKQYDIKKQKKLENKRKNIQFIMYQTIIDFNCINEIMSYY